jgi:replication-associated recombination protein RarA
MEQAQQNLARGRHTILFVDEIHRFNKSQQDALLPYAESGLVTFIGATTENPSFEVNSALLSRAAVYVLESLTQDELAERIGRSRPKITNTIRLLRLPASVQLKVAAGVLSAGHARAILALEFEAAMEAMADKVVKQGLSVRAVEELVAIAKPEGKRGNVSPGGIQDSLKGLADQVGDRFSTKAKISLGKGKGVLTIEFGSVADLYRILDEMGIERDQH